MADGFERAVKLVRTFHEACFGGRLARASFLIRVVPLIGTLWLVIAPVGSILSVSDQMLRDAYTVSALVLALVCIFGIFCAFVKRFHDIGWPTYATLLFLIAAPSAIACAATSYQSYRYEIDKAANTSGLFDVAFWAAMLIPFAFAMRRGDSLQNRFGSVPSPVEHIWSPYFTRTAVIGAALILIPTLIFAGFFQSGVWVGRGSSPDPMPFKDSNVSGYRFMKCWNVKGVGAGSGESPASGIFRDGYSDSVFDFFIDSNKNIDIAVAGGLSGSTFRGDGFTIQAFGLPEPKGSGFIMIDKLERFTISATYNSGGTVNITSFAFAKSDKHGGYQMVMSTSLSADKDGIFNNFPPARGRLMIGDCAPV